MTVSIAASARNPNPPTPAVTWTVSFQGPGPMASYSMLLPSMRWSSSGDFAGMRPTATSGQPSASRSPYKASVQSSSVVISPRRIAVLRTTPGVRISKRLGATSMATSLQRSMATGGAGSPFATRKISACSSAARGLESISTNVYSLDR